METAASIGIGKGYAADFICDSIGTAANFSALCDVTTSVRQGMIVSAGWKKAIDEDVKNRKRRK